MRHNPLIMYPETGTHWSVGKGGIEPEVVALVKEKGGNVVTDDKGRSQFVLLQLGEDRCDQHEQIRLKFTVEEAGWLIDALKEVIEEINTSEKLEVSEVSEVSFELPPAAPASLPPPDLSKINLDIPD